MSHLEDSVDAPSDECHKTSEADSKSEQVMIQD